MGRKKEEGFNNEFMLGAYLSFLHWAAGEQSLWAHFEKDTGLKLPSFPKNIFEAMIDKATGFDAERGQVLLKYLKWATETYWGAADAPPAYFELLKEIKP